MSLITSFDQSLLFFIQSIRFILLDNVMLFVTTLGDGGAIWIVTSIILLFNRKTRLIGLMVLLALMLSNIITNNILKDLIARPRPYVDFPEVSLIIHKLTSFSFPSGHTSSSFAAAYILSYFFKKTKIWWWLLASLIAFSRIYLFVHYPTDILGGIAVGLLCGQLVIMLFKKIKPQLFLNKKTDK